MGTLILTSVAWTTKGGLSVVPSWAWTFFASLLLYLTSKVIEKLFKYRSDERDDRKEYREEIEKLRDRIDAMEQQATLLRERYYAEQIRSQQYYLLLIRNNIQPDTALIPEPPEFGHDPTPPEDEPKK